MSDEMEEIISDFLTEAEESLDKIDPLFVELETKGYNKELLNDIFRSMHTLKGAAGFLGFQPIVDVAHNSESIMKKLREGEIPLTRPLMDVILKSVDMLRLLLKHIKHKDNVSEDTSSLVKELEGALQSAQVMDAGDKPQDAEEVHISSTSSPCDQEQGVENASNLNALIPPIPVKAEALKSEQDNVEPVQKIMPTAEPQDKAAGDKREIIQTLRVDVDRIDNVMNLTGEVVMIRNRLLNLVNYLEDKYADDSHVESLSESVAFLDLVTSDMQLAVMKMRMQPIKKVFGKFPRLVRDIAANLGKDVDLRITGEDTEVDKAVIEQIGDPMVHIIRNAIDHGLDSTEQRLAKGKSEKGTITIDAFQKGNQIVIEVSDDGRGIDVERVKKKALEKGLITEEEAPRMTDEAAINLIFLPGFSTNDVATELSGRGVGMDVVKTNISRLNGYVEVLSKKDFGSTFRISIPLTLSIVQALMVRVRGAQYAVPLAPIVEILKVSKAAIKEVAGQKVLAIRGKVHPFFELSTVLGYGSCADSEYRYLVVVSISDKSFCLAVDEVLGQEEAVIKTVDGVDAASSYILGATITGSGRVVLILDLAAISRSMVGR